MRSRKNKEYDTVASAMQISQTELKGLYTITPDVFQDSRGAFMEIFHSEKFKTVGLDLTFVQENISVSKKGVVRGLHFQWDKPLGKYVRVGKGSAFCVAVDIRKNSPTRARWLGFDLDESNKIQLYLVPGFAFGFCATSGITEIDYHYTAHYNPKGESNIIWNDPDVGIRWPVKEPILSPRDQEAETFKEWLARPESEFFKM